MKWIVSIYLLFAWSLITWGQIDTEFWFAAPAVSEGHGDAPIVLRITTFDQPANIRISQPANPGFPVLNRFIDAQSTITYDLTNQKGRLENAPAFAVLNKGLYIESDQPVTAYYEVNHQNNPDIFALKGKNALGKEFYIPAQDFWQNAIYYTPEPRSSIDIVATKDNTTVTIIPSKSVRGHSAGNPFSISLDRGETYSVEAASHTVRDQLTGTKVTSDQFIAITLKDDSNEKSPCHDLGGDQLVPTHILGNEYVVVRGFLSPSDKVFILAIQDQTQIFIDGDQSNPILLNEGESYTHNLSATSMHIRGDKPVYVLHATGFGCEIGLALLPKLECTGSRSVSFTRSTNENFGVILITSNGFQDAFIMNGSNDLIQAAMFDTVPGTAGRYVAARINFSDAATPGRASTINNSKGTFHLGTINGGDVSGCRYGYFSDFKTLKILTEDSKICLGSGITLEASGTDIYTWFGDTAINGITEAIIEVTPTETNDYMVIGSDMAGDCIDTAFLTLEVFKWPQPTVDISQACIGREVSFAYTGSEELASLTWIIDGDTLAIDWMDTINLYFEDPGNRDISIQAINPAGCRSDTSFIFPVGGVLVVLDTQHNLTLGESILLEPDHISGDLNSSTINWTPSDGVDCINCFRPQVSPAAETTFELAITDTLGCTTTYPTLVYVDSPLFAPNAFTPNGDGINDRFTIYASGITLELLQVFDRWGQLVFETSHPELGWNGKYNSQNAQPGVYTYYFKGYHQRSSTAIEKSGDVLLIR